MSGFKPPIHPDADGVILDDVPCRQCGYNLRTLRTDAVCPECGRAVRPSLMRAHGLLRFADAGWLARMRLGVTLTLWLILAVVVGYAGLMAYMVSFVFRGGPPDFVTLIVVSMTAAYLLMFAWFAVVWLLTTPEPPVPGADRASPLPRWIRGLAVASLVFAILYLPAIDLAAVSQPVPPQNPLLTAPTVGGVLGAVSSVTGSVVSVVVFVLLLVHMRRIARRDDSQGLARLMTAVLWLTLALCAAWVFTTVASLIMAVSFGPPMTATGPAFVATAGSPWPGVATTWPAGPATSTALATTTAPVGLAPPQLPAVFGVMMLGGCVLTLAGLGSSICGVVALFWFRRIFTRALELRGVGWVPVT